MVWFFFHWNVLNCEWFISHSFARTHAIRLFFCFDFVGVFFSSSSSFIYCLTKKKKQIYLEIYVARVVSIFSSIFAFTLACKQQKRFERREKNRREEHITEILTGSDAYTTIIQRLLMRHTHKKKHLMQTKLSKKICTRVKAIQIDREKKTKCVCIFVVPNSINWISRNYSLSLIVCCCVIHIEIYTEFLANTHTHFHWIEEKEEEEEEICSSLSQMNVQSALVSMCIHTVFRNGYTNNGVQRINRIHHTRTCIQSHRITDWNGANGKHIQQWRKCTYVLVCVCAYVSLDGVVPWEQREESERKQNNESMCNRDDHV